MFFSSVLLALALLSSVSSLVVPRQNPPPGWATDYLEPYKQYHERYLAIGCREKHNDKQFFDDCCHPMLATEKLETARPAKCIPHTDHDEDCDDDDHSTQAPAAKTTTPHVDTPKPTPTPTPTPTPAPSPTTTHTSSPPKDTPAPQVKVPVPSVKAPAPSSAPSPSGGDQTGGHATFFYQNGVAGACGTVHGDYDLVAAMDYRRYGNTSVKSDLCGKKVQITNSSNGKSVQVIVADACPTCDSQNSIDLSVGAFLKLATLGEGYVPITWSFV